jgi:hypothetical protein
MRVHAAAGAVALSASDHAFAARKGNGEVAAWGDANEGGLIPDPIAPFLKDIVQVASTSQAFAVLRRTGEVFAWGSPRFGGQIPGTVGQAVQIAGSTTAFTALSATGEPTCWGEPDEGGTAPDNVAIECLAAGYGVFAAILRDGRAMSWGHANGRYDGQDAVAVYAIGRHVVVITGSGKLVTWGPTPLDLSELDGQVSHATPVFQSHAIEVHAMHATSSIQASPTVTDVVIIGEAIVGGTLMGSYKYENEVENPEGASTYSWTVNGVEVAKTLELRILADYVGAEIVFTVTPVAASGEIGAPVSSAAKTVESGFQNISDEENANSFMKQHGNFSFYVPEPSDRIFVSTGGAFSLIDPPSADVFVQGQNDYGAIVPEAIKIYLRNNPATVLYATERDFGALVPIGSSNQLLLWSKNIVPGFDLSKLRNIRSVYANGGAFAFIYRTISAENKWVGAIGSPAFGGTIPDHIHLKLVSDPPRAVYGTFDAFAVLTESGRIYTWGNAASGGTINPQAQALLDGMTTTRIISNMSAFCAIDDNGGFVPWGNPTNGGTIPADRLNNIYDDGGVKSIIAARAAFCAITRGRAKAVSWGNAAQGGDMHANAAGFAARGNIILCRAATWAFCMINALGQSQAWGHAGSGGTIPTGKTAYDENDSVEPTDIGVLMSASGVKHRIRALFMEKMRKAGVDIHDKAAAEVAAARLAGSMDRVTSQLSLANGYVSVYANDTSFFLLAQDELGFTNEVLVWGRLDAGGSMPDATRQALMASQIKATYCTNGAYGVISSQGSTEGVVTVWGVSLANLDAGEIPATPPEIAQKLSRGILELYSIKRQPPVNPTPVHTDPSFAARHRDGSYVLWGGNVVNQVFVPEDQDLAVPSAARRPPGASLRRYSYT